ncbi:MAG: hypothetical protein ABJF11_05195 [Reichenbachiella sp.]|uniref:hypothetical protein n=1 Tax=Reichenbachiella sp. TaxID=2184521 RepID=UPI0032646750
MSDYEITTVVGLINGKQIYNAGGQLFSHIEGTKQALFRNEEEFNGPYSNGIDPG